MDILNFACDVISVPLPENKENLIKHWAKSVQIHKSATNAVADLQTSI